KSEMKMRYATLGMEKGDSSNDDYIVDTQESEENEEISGDADDPLNLKRRQSPYQRFVNRRYSPHEPVPSMRNRKVVLNEGPKRGVKSK
ncbi:hypothetical protein GN958_ATG01417, partial [Phytophthora infestans]